MKVIFKKDVPNIARIGEVKDVVEGYARNFLFPKNLAVPASSGNLKNLENLAKITKGKILKEKETFQEISTRLNEIILSIYKPAGESNRLFGSVTKDEIVDALAKQGIKINKKGILLDNPIKLLGNYTIPVKLHQDMKGEIKIEVLKES